MVLSDLSIRRPVLRDRDVAGGGPRRPDRLRPADRARVPQDRRARGHGRDQLSRRQSADIIESQVTQPLEDSLAGIEGIDYMTLDQPPGEEPDHRPLPARPRPRRRRQRRARPGQPGARPAARRASTSRSSPRSRPTPSRSSTWRSRRDRHSPLEVTDFADRFVKDRLQNLPGVADVRIFGERRYAMRIWLDAARLAAYHLTPAGRRGPRSSARTSRSRPAASRARRASSRSSAETDLKHAAAVRGHHPARGERLSGPPRRRRRGPSSDRSTSGSTSASTAAAPSLWASSSRRPPTRSISARRSRRSCRSSSGICPRACAPTWPTTASIFISHSIQAVFETIGEAIVLVVLVIFFFLRSLRATLIPLVTIPVAGRGVRADVRLRLQHQHADAAGDGAGDRPRGRRRDRDAREHLPPRRGRYAAGPGGARSAPRRSASRCSR